MRLVFIAIAFCFIGTLSAQQRITWDDLSGAEFESKMDSTTGVEVLFPIFDSHVKSLDGKIIVIEGFLVPLDTVAGTYMLCKTFDYVAYDCFHYGRPQNETIQINLGDSSKYDRDMLDLKASYKGRFKLNSIDVSKLIFILEDAKVVSSYE